MVELSDVSAKDRQYITAVLDKASVLPVVDSIENLRPEQLNVLAGGVSAATYLVRSREGQVIIKISSHDIAAEAEALQAWRVRHARVPEVLAYGTVPGTSGKGRMKYIIEAAMVTKYGRLVETCANFLVRAPEQSRAIGRLLGAELTKMHRAVAPRTFGEFSDAAGKKAAYQSWNSYMQGYLHMHAEYLKSLGVSDRQIDRLGRYIHSRRFVARGRYIHGDFSIRNAAVKSYEPLKISVFDPNPLVGDPSWDIAVLFNNCEFQKRRLRQDDGQKDLYTRDRQLLTGFKQGYQRKIIPENLYVSQLMQAILQAHYTETRVSQKKAEKLDLEVREAFIRDIVRKMVGDSDE